jgi:hypothetical protein
MIVDAKFRRRGLARKITQLACAMLWQKGAQALECSWTTGSHSGEMWQTIVGVRPYETIGVYALNAPGTDDDWKPVPAEQGIWLDPTTESKG